MNSDNNGADLSAALTAYDRVALNLDKLDRVWQRMQDLLPEGPFIGSGDEDEVTYDQLGEAWAKIAASLPAIDGWRLEAGVIDYAAIGQTRLEYLELGEQMGALAFENQVTAPATETIRYRQRLARARQMLVRQRGSELVKVIDDTLAPVPIGVDEELPTEEAAPRLGAINEAVSEIERLVGEALSGGPRQSDLHRHLHFATPQDLRDIAAMDWPAFRPHVEQALYGDEDPVPVDVDDLTQLATAPASPVPFQVHWERTDADGFERLLARILEQSGSYVRITRPIHVNAADAGRDIEAFRRISHGLTGERFERVIVQAKHWPKRGINASDISDLVYSKLPLWEGEPIRGLIFGTTGYFTQEAVRWVDDHNREAKRPDIELWSVSELESFLRKWPAVLAEFGLVD
ncbi:restriction endonuclease [Spirillospora sp. NBC_00431]